VLAGLLEYRDGHVSSKSIRCDGRTVGHSWHGCTCGTSVAPNFHQLLPKSRTLSGKNAELDPGLRRGDGVG